MEGLNLRLGRQRIVKDLCKALKHNCFFANKPRARCSKCRWVQFYVRQHSSLCELSVARSTRLEALTTLNLVSAQLETVIDFILDCLKDLFENCQEFCEEINFKEFGFVSESQLGWSIEAVYKIRRFFAEFDEKAKDFLCSCFQGECWLRLRVEAEAAREALFTLKHLLTDSLFGDPHLVHLDKAVSLLVGAQSTTFSCCFSKKRLLLKKRGKILFLILSSI